MNRLNFPFFIVFIFTIFGQLLSNELDQNILHLRTTHSSIFVKENVALMDLCATSCEMLARRKLGMLGWCIPATNHCLWPGIECVNSSVTKIVLKRDSTCSDSAGSDTPNPLFCGPLPSSMKNLRNLTFISLSFHSISLVQSLSELTRLKTIILCHNRIANVENSLSSLSKLEFLDLSSNQLSNLNGSFGSLVSLTSMSLDYNLLTELSDDCGISKLSRLHTLHLMGNQIERLDISFSKMTSLTNLNLHINRLTAVPDSFRYLTNCVTLKMSHNKLKTLDKALFANLVNLSKLDLGNNLLEFFDFGMIVNMKLKKLDLSWNMIQKLDFPSSTIDSLDSLSLANNQLVYLDENIRTLSGLTKLELYGNRLNTVKNIGNIPSLKWLYLSTNLLTSPLDSSLSLLTDLTHLDISHNMLTNLDDCITELANLTSLTLSFNPITEIGPNIGRLKKLQVALNLRGTGISSLPRQISELTLLESLNVAYNSLTSLNNIDGLHALTQLDAKVNMLTHWDPALIANMANLMSIALSYNQYTDIHIIFDNMTELSDIDVAHNKLKSFTFSGKPHQLLGIVAHHNELVSLDSSFSFLSTELWHLDLGYNKLETLSDALIGMDLIGHIDLTGNSLTSLPLWFGQLTGLTGINLSRNKLSSKGLPDTIGNLDAVNWFDVSHNPKLEYLPNSITQLSALEVFMAFNCSLAELPSEFGNNYPDMKYVDISTNKLESLPVSIKNMAKLAVLKVQHNRLQYISLASIVELDCLRHFDISFNMLTIPVSDVMRATRHLPVLNTLVLEGLSAQYDTINAVRDSLYPFSALSSLNLAQCKISGELSDGTIATLPIFPSNPSEVHVSSVVDLNLNGNDLDGSLPSGYENSNMWLALPSTLKLSGNPRLHDPSNSLPIQLAFDDNSKLSFKGNYVCSAVVGRVRPMQVDLDPAYYNYRHCNCSKNFVGKPPICFECPSSYDPDVIWCENGMLNIARGYWIEGIEQGGEILNPSATPPPFSQVVRCPSEYLSNSNCRGTQDGQFKCAENTFGRFCSACTSGHYKDGSQCKKCSNQSEWVTILVLSLGVLVLMVIMANKRGTANASTNIFVFYCQAMSILLPRFEGWRVGSWIMSLGSVLGIGSGTTLVGIECLSPNANATARYALHFYFMAFMPLFWVTFVPVFLQFYNLISKRTTHIRQSIISTIFALLLFTYIPSSTWLVSSISLSDGYLSDSPWISTDNRLWLRSILPIGIIGVVFYVIGLPLLIGVLLWRNKGSITHYESLRLLWIRYKEHSSGFELCIVIRRLLLVITVSSLPRSWTPVFIFLVVFVAVTIQLHFRPYREKFDNLIEVLSLMAILLSYLVGILVSNGTLHSAFSNQSEVLILTLNIVIILIFLCRFVYIFFGKVKVVAVQVSSRLSSLDSSNRMKKFKKNGFDMNDMSTGLLESQE